MNKIIKKVVKFSTLNVTDQFRPSLEIYAAALSAYYNLAQYAPDDYRCIDKSYVKFVVSKIRSQGNNSYDDLIDRLNSFHMNIHGRMESLL